MKTKTIIRSKGGTKERRVRVAIFVFLTYGTLQRLSGAVNTESSLSPEKEESNLPSTYLTAGD